MSRFDSVAAHYDRDFSEAEIGRKLRRYVWHHLDRHTGKNPLNILEINCGTGADALHLGEMGHRVTATDASGSMIEVARGKPGGAGVSFLQADFRDIGRHFDRDSFDLVFSDFGGLNCVDGNELRRVLQDAEALLKPEGRLIAVIMGTKCLWERIYFLLKANRRDAFRRSRGAGVPAQVGDTFVHTHYFSPGQVCGMTAMIPVEIIPVGFFLPPTYLEGYFRKHPGLLNLLERAEYRFSRFSVLANLSDHYMVILRKRS